MEVKLEQKQYEQMMGYCLHNKNIGRLKYLWEISIEDVFYKDFLDWLDKCEEASLTYAFVVIKRYEGHRLLYGFTNFEIVEDFTFSCFDFKFENDDILRHRFMDWRTESDCYLLPFSLMGFFKVMDTIEEHYSNIKPLITEED